MTEKKDDNKLGLYPAQDEPGQRERSYYWRTAIGLQAVDGLKPSEYLIATANENIKGDITIDEAIIRIDNYYKERPGHDVDSGTAEADKVSVKITSVLKEKAFSFSPVAYIDIHRRLFEDVYDFAGKMRDYNISKDEWVLNGETVYYVSAQSIRETLNYDFDQEKAFNYKGLSTKQTVEHIAAFISGLWQIHAFGEGNTRTTAVFAIKYLRHFGFDVANDIFAENAWYFRNALVRANYNNIAKGIHKTQEYLNRFFGNLLFGEKHSLKNRELIAVPERAPEGNPGAPVPGKNVPINVPINDTEKRILSIISDNPAVKSEEIAAAISKSRKTVQRYLKRLREKGIISRVGSRKTGLWEIAADADSSVDS